MVKEGSALALCEQGVVIQEAVVMSLAEAGTSVIRSSVELVALLSGSASSLLVILMHRSKDLVATLRTELALHRFSKTRVRLILVGSRFTAGRS